jgi:hypothetical protein
MAYRHLTTEQLEEPEDWMCRRACISLSIVEVPKDGTDNKEQKMCGERDIRPVDTTISNRVPELLYDQILYPRLLLWQFDLPVEALEILGEISLLLPRDPQGLWMRTGIQRCT